MQNDILCAIDNKKSVIMLALDLPAAFDTVDHSVLLSRLTSSYGLRGTVLAWFHLYLASRKQYVRVEGCTSLFRGLDRSVPQGSVLGPLPYSMYTNAMKDYLKPNLEPNPDEVVLHVGTNDLRTKSPQEVADGIVDLGRQVEGSSDARVVISALVSRRDKLNEKVPEVNKLLKRYCRQHEWKLIEHNNITEKGLNKGGLHLSIEGNKRFFNNFCDSLSTH